MVDRLYEVSETFKKFSAPCIENGEHAVFTTVQLPMQKFMENIDQYKVDKGAENSELTAEGNAQVKQFAADLLGIINQRRDEISQGGMHSYERSVLDFLAFYCESAQRGINVCEGSGMEDPAAKIAYDQLKSLKTPANKEGMERLEEANTELYLSDFFTKALDTQKKYIDYQNDKGSNQIKSDLTSNYSELDRLAKEVKENAPDRESAKLMLGSAQANLQNKDGFIGGTLDKIIKLCVAQKLDVALDRFQTRRSSFLTVFSGQSTDEHKNVLEPAKKLQEILKQLQSGKDKDGKELSAEDKLKLAEDAVRFGDDMEKNAQTYRNIKTKDGATTPNTPAGKARLGAAIELRDMAVDVKELACRLAGTSIRKVRNAVKNAQADKVMNVESLSNKLGVNAAHENKGQHQHAGTRTEAVKGDDNRQMNDPVLGNDHFSLSN